MNLVGKIFVVLILVASTVFMTMGLMVYATHINWYNDVMSKDGLQAKLKEERDRARDLRADIEKYKAEAAAERALKDQSVAKAETERNVLAAKQVELQKDVETQATRLETAAKALQVAEEGLTAARKENVDLREDIRLAQKQVDEKLKLATQTEDKLHIALGQLADLKKRADQLALDNAKASALLKTVGMTFDTPLSRQPPQVFGRVLAVDKNDRAEISIGSDDGLLEGNTLEIIRGSKYLGKMQIVEAHPHRAIGAILPEFKRDVIRKDDEVATKL
jgi:hypothetical protein